MASVKELNDVFDYKKAITTTFDRVLRELVNDEGKNIRSIKPDSKLLIITQNAYIEGEINHFDEEAETYFFSEALNELGKRLNELPQRMEAVNLTGPLHLKEVIISPLTNPAEKRNLNEMVLFTDQILGLTIK